jgi:hypothetical protein
MPSPKGTKVEGSADAEKTWRFVVRRAATATPSGRRSWLSQLPFVGMANSDGSSVSTPLQVQA